MASLRARRADALADSPSPRLRADHDKSSKSGQSPASDTWPLVKRLESEYNIRCMTSVQGISSNYVWCGARDSSIHVRAAETGEVVRRIVAPRSRLDASAMVQVGNRVWVGGSDAVIRVIDAESGDILKECCGHTGPVKALAYSVGVVWSTAEDWTIRLWDEPTGNMIKLIPGSSTQVRCLAAVGDDVWTGCQDAKIRLYSKAGTPTKELSGSHTGGVQCMVRVDDDRVWSGSEDASICVWSEGGLNVQKLTGHHISGVISLVYLGKHVWSGGDKTVRVWDPQTLQVLKVFEFSSWVYTMTAVASVAWVSTSDRSVSIYRTTESLRRPRAPSDALASAPATPLSVASEGEMTPSPVSVSHRRRTGAMSSDTLIRKRTTAVSDASVEVEELRKQLAAQEEQLLDMRIKLKQQEAVQVQRTGTAPCTECDINRAARLAAEERLAAMTARQSELQNIIEQTQLQLEEQDDMLISERRQNRLSQETITELRAENERLKAAAAGTNSDTQQLLSSQREHMERQTRELAEQRTEIDRLRQRIKAGAEAANSAAIMEIEQLKQELQTMHERIRVYTADNVEQVRLIESQKQAIEDQHAAMMRQEKIINDLRSERDWLKQEISNSASGQSDLAAALQKQLEQAQQSLATEQARTEEQISRVQELSQQLRTAKQETDDQRRAALDAQDKVAQIQESVEESLASQTREHERAYQALQAKHDALKLRLSELQASTAQPQEREHLLAQLEQLQNQVQAAESKAQQERQKWQQLQVECATTQELQQQGELERADLQRQVALLEQQLKSLQQNQQALQSRLTEEQQSTTALQQQCDDQEQKLQSLQGSLTVERGKAELLQQKYQEEHIQLEAVQKLLETSEQQLQLAQSSVTAERSASSSAQAKLRQQLDALAEQLKHAEDELAQERDRTISLQSQLAGDGSAQSQREASLTARITQLQEELTTQRATARDLQRQLQEKEALMEQDRTRLAETDEKVKDALSQSKQQEQALRAELKEITQERDDLQETLVSLGTDLANARQREKSLQQQLKRATESTTILDGVLQGEQQRAAQQVEEMKVQLQQQQDRLTQVSASRDELRDKLGRLSGELDKALDNIRLQAADHSVAVARAQEETSSLRQQLQAATSTKEQLQVQLEETRAKLQQALSMQTSKQASEQQERLLASLGTQLQQVTEERDALQKRLDKNATFVRSLEAQNAALKAELDLLRLRVSDHQSEQEEQEDTVKHQLAQEMTIREKLAKQLAATTAELAELQQTYSVQQTMLASQVEQQSGVTSGLKQHHDTLQQERTLSQQQHQQVVQERAKLQEQCESLQLQLQKSTNELADLKQKHFAAQQLIEELTAALEQANSQAQSGLSEQLRAQLALVEQSNNTLKLQREEVALHVAQLSEELAQERETSEQLRVQMQQMQQGSEIEDGLRQRIGELQTQLEQVQKSESQAQQLTAERAALQARIADLEAEIARLRALLAQLQQQQQQPREPTERKTRPVQAPSVVTYDAERSKFTSESVNVIFSFVTRLCAGDKDLRSRLPIKSPDDFLNKLMDGVLYCKLINKLFPGCLDERVIVTPAQTVRAVQGNISLALNTALAVGCDVEHITVQQITQNSVDKMLDLVWQMIRWQALSHITLQNYPSLRSLLAPEEQSDAISVLPRDTILLRWVNQQLAAAKCPRTLTNFCTDLQDGEIHRALLVTAMGVPSHELPPATAPMTELAPAMHAKCGVCAETITPKAMIEGDGRLNLWYLCTMLGSCAAQDLSVPQPKRPITADSAVDNEETHDHIVREERGLRMWLNRLGMDIDVTSLFSDLSDGIVLLKALDKIAPGIVPWNKVSMTPRHTFARVENCDLALKLGKRLGMHLDIAAKSIETSAKKALLSVVWQLMQYSSLATLRAQANGAAVHEIDLVTWANNKVRAAGKSTHIESFRDRSLRNGLFLIDLLAALEPQAINYSLVNTADTDDAHTQNARYIASVVRQLPISFASGFLVWQDVKYVRHRSLVPFVGGLATAYGGAR